MSTTLINSLSSSHLQSLLSPIQKGLGSILSAASGSLTSVAQDTGGLSPLGQLTSTLRQVQQTNPSQYKLVTQQIASNLLAAAQTDQSQGNTTGAAQLTQLAGDFSSASNSGQLPTFQDFAQAVGGHHHHPHHLHGNPENSIGSSASSGASTTSGTGASLASLFQANSGLFGANAASIIQSTLSDAGLN